MSFQQKFPHFSIGQPNLKSIKFSNNWFKIFLAVGGAIYVVCDKKNHFGRMICGVMFLSLVMFSFLVQSDPYIPLNTGLISRLWLQPSIFYVTFIAFGIKMIIDGIHQIRERVDEIPALANDMINAGFIEAVIWIASIMIAANVFVYSDRSQLGWLSNQAISILKYNPEIWVQDRIPILGIWTKIWGFSRLRKKKFLENYIHMSFYTKLEIFALLRNLKFEMYSSDKPIFCSQCS